MNHGDTGMMMMATTFVMLQTPAMGLAQAGLIRRKNALSMLMQTLTGFIIGSMLWFLGGFSLVFGPSLCSAGIMGRLDNAFFLDVRTDTCYPNSGGRSIPGLIFAAFQMMFAVMTPVIVTGAWAERMSFEAFLVFTTLWPILVYYPLSHWIWNVDGILSRWGAFDFAGGLTIHTSSGVAALAVTAVLPGRMRPHKDALAHHNLPIMILGGSLIWGGWYSFNGGSALAANQQCASAVMNTHISACTAGMVWSIGSYIRNRQWALTEIISGVFAGLSAVTPGSGDMTARSAFFVGLSAGTASLLWFIYVKPRIGDDALDVAALQGVPGIVGSLAVGIVAEGNYAPSPGLIAGGGFGLLGKQVVAALITIVWSFVWTYALMRFMQYTVKIQISAEAEEIGLDLVQIGEQAYDDRLDTILDIGEAAMTVKMCSAARAGDLKKMKSLIASKGDPLAADYDKRTPLHLAAAMGHLHVVRSLTRHHDVDINAMDIHNNTPLGDAIRHNKQAIVDYLIEVKADPVLCKDSTFDVCGSLIDAAAADNSAEVRWRLEINGDDVNTADYDKRTALHVAASRGHEVMVCLLLKEGASADVTDRWGNTPTDEAINHRYNTVAGLLLGSEREVLKLSSKKIKPLAPGTRAAYKSSEQLSANVDGDLSAALLQHDGADVELVDSTVLTPDQVDMCTADRALLVAASNGDEDEVKTLLGKGAKINACDYDTRTALHLAANGGFLKVVRLLLSFKDCEVNTKDRFGCTPLQDAQKHRFTDIATCLLEHGATITNERTAKMLCEAAQKGDLSELQRLRENGANLECGDYDCRTALHLAASEGHLDCVKWLLTQGVDLERKDGLGGTPLDDAEREGHQQVAQYLRREQKIKVEKVF